MSRPTVLVLRHAEAEGNAERRFIGQHDVPLSALGWRQAEALTRRLRLMPITHIVSSDLQRCLDTVKGLAEDLGLQIAADSRWREIANGQWGGLVGDEIAERWPDAWQRYRGGEDVARPDGERWADVRMRVVEAFEELADGLTDRDVVVVSTHGGPGALLAMWATGISGTAFGGPFGPLANASITTLTLPGPRLLGINDVGHLPTDLLRA
ncbi:MAG: histidine phosphatase family protein [Acidimicrobiia bacterium]|nr:histidine phosphatase family protein [Acidimicrobiia bacterium]MDH3397304.1 histidine phosphatase family protein [Acidimicrobiia bacterium]